MSDLDAYREAKFAPVGLRHGADTRLYTIGVLLSIDTVKNRAKVSVNDGAGSWVPVVPAVYDGVRTVHVLLDPMQGGRAQLVLGPCEEPSASPDPLPQPPPDPPPDVVSRTVTIRPTWSGSWRVSRAAWDQWNTDQYGGRSDLYQGDAFGSGTLKGLATYGNQITNLGATAITSAVLTVVRQGWNSGSSGNVTVQGSPHGSRPVGAPTSSGDTVSKSLAVGQRGVIALTSSMRESLRIGGYRGLCLVGTFPMGVRGTSLADGMALRITYTRPG